MTCLMRRVSFLKKKQDGDFTDDENIDDGEVVSTDGYMFKKRIGLFCLLCNNLLLQVHIIVTYTVD